MVWLWSVAGFVVALLVGVAVVEAYLTFYVDARKKFRAIAKDYKFKETDSDQNSQR